MMTKSYFFFISLFLPISKTSNSSLILHSLEHYIKSPVKNPTLLISGSVVTITSLSQWGIFDIRYLFGGNIEQTMIVNTLAIVQFIIGWRATARKVKSGTMSTKNEIRQSEQKPLTHN